MSEPLKAIERRIYQNRGAIYEGDVFSVLRTSPFVIRSFEFALADGAIDCTYSYKPSLSYADRYWSMYSRRYDSEASTLLLFDVKSTIAEDSGDQVYITTVGQRRHVAFYIGINAADPTFVEVVPNYHQNALAVTQLDNAYTKGPAATRDVAVNISRVSTMPASAYGGLDQCMSPYRMPLTMLAEAIARIRRRALGGPPYVNPGTNVAFSNWQPKTTLATDFLRPADDTDQASAYEAALEIYRITKYDLRSELHLNFVGLQPDLGDFILSYGGQGRIIQHKLDSALRARDSSLSRVSIARQDGLARAYYFSAFDRFDFLWFQFTFSKGPPETQVVFFFIPERELPDEFFTSTEKEANFELYPHFQKYKIIMDEDGDWLQAVARVMKDNPHPRKKGDRPARPRHEDQSPDIATAEVMPSARSNVILGRAEYKEVLIQTHRRLFYRLMARCAERRSGLLVVLATNQSLGDFGFGRYRWTQKEQAAFRQYARPPRAAHHLPYGYQVVPLSVYSQYAETCFQGPNLRPAHFRRLNSSTHRKLVIWDLGGPDTGARPLPHAVIPSDDFLPSDSQRHLLESNLQKSEEKKSPNVSALLHTGLSVSEYGVDGLGVLAYEEDCWDRLWMLLDQFTIPGEFEHPVGHKRHALDYVHDLRQLHQRLRDQHGQEDPQGGDPFA